MANNRKLSASCVVIKDNHVLVVKHTYGAAKGKYLIPGGFSEENEMPQVTAEREVLEEAFFMPIDTLLTSDSVVGTTKEIIKAVLVE